MLEIIKAGLLDTIQDLGRFGYQDIGLNPNGIMDQTSGKTANMLLGNALNAPLIEMHFPAPTIKFHTNTIICLTGAHFIPCINHFPISLYQNIVVEKGAELSFQKPIHGRTCYLGVKNGLQVPEILKSRSTNLTAQFGGLHGRALKKGDQIPFIESTQTSFAPHSFSLNRMPNIQIVETINMIPAWEWSELDEMNKDLFLTQEYDLMNHSNRMGFYALAKPICRKVHYDLISYPQTKGLIQLLPSGKLLILMADHPTTGGYPRLGLIDPLCLDFFSQMTTHQRWKFIIKK